MILKSDIPETVNYLPEKKIRNFKFEWDLRDDKYNGDFDKHFNGVFGRDCTVLVPNSKAASKKEIVSLPNKPMKGLRFVGRSRYSTNSDHVLVLLPNGYVVEMGLDSFTEVVLNEGLQLGGVIPGEWIWARVLGSMKLIRIGTGFHQSVLDYLKRESKPEYKLQQLNVGNIYATADKKFAVFLGFINTFSMQVRCHPDDKEYISWRNNQYDIDWQKKKKLIRYDVNFKKVDLATLWFDLWYEESNLFDRRSQIEHQIKSFNKYSFIVKKKHDYVEELKLKKLSIQDDIILSIRKSTEKAAIQSLKFQAAMESTQHNHSYGFTQQPDKIDLNSYNPSYEAATYIRSEAMKACMVPFGVEPIIPDILKKFNPFLRQENSELSKALEKEKLFKRKNKKS